MAYWFRFPMMGYVLRGATGATRIYMAGYSDLQVNILTNTFNASDCLLNDIHVTTGSAKLLLFFSALLKLF